MANTLYNYSRERFLTGLNNWLTDDIKVSLLSAAYVFDAAHQHYDDISGSAVVSGAVSITGRTATDGAADGNDVTFTTVTGSQITAIVIYADSGTPATSPLVAYINVATGLPITPNGGNIILTWDNGPNRIFRL